MDSKIKKSFQNSKFYRNFNNIDFLVLKFQKIRIGYIESKIKLQNVLNVLLCNKNNIDKSKLDSYRKILEEKIKSSKDIKKYAKYSNNINDDFVKSVQIGNIKNIDTSIKNGADIHAENDLVLKFSSINGNLDVVQFLVKNGANIHAENDYAL
jgi:ankyrin repeat protein